MFKQVETIKLYHVNAFATEAFRGNPAVVALLPKARDTVWMQTMAAEMNQPATAFVWPHEDPFKRVFRIRWFSPIAEIPLCGHGSLAAAYILWSEGVLRPDLKAVFETGAGRVSATYDLGSWVTLDFPTLPTEAMEMPEGLLSSLGVESAVEVRQDDTFWMVVIDSAETVRTLTPNFTAIAKHPVRAVAVTAQSDQPEYDFISRKFAPSVGFAEDPVTGSSHCRLTPYWAEKLGRQKMTAYQASARGGVLRVENAGERVKISGRAVTLVRGEMQV